MSDPTKVQAYLKTIDEVIQKGPFKDDWESLSHYGIPDWYARAKFGLFVHWGVYSVPAFHNEWYSREMYQKGSRTYAHHRKTYGRDFGYKDFIPQFRRNTIIRRSGQSFLQKAAPGMSRLLESITTASKCIRASCANGTPSIWGLNGTYMEN